MLVSPQKTILNIFPQKDPNSKTYLWVKVLVLIYRKIGLGVVLEA